MPCHDAWRPGRLRLDLLARSRRRSRRRSAPPGPRGSRATTMVALTYFGEGATSAHDFHTGLNFAGVRKIPVVFVCRNNGWAISVPRERQTGSRDHRAEGDRLRHARRARRRQRPPRRARGDAARARARAAGRGADARRVRHLPHRGPLDLRRPARLPARRSSSSRGRSKDPHPAHAPLPRAPRRARRRRGRAAPARRSASELAARARARRRRSRRSRRSRRCSRTSTPSRPGTCASSSTELEAAIAADPRVANPRHSDA